MIWGTDEVQDESGPDDGIEEGTNDVGLAHAVGDGDGLGGAEPLDPAGHGRADVNERGVRGVASLESG
jgi:hypothetical protein